jgi:hypothetical protein
MVKKFLEEQECVLDTNKWPKPETPEDFILREVNIEFEIAVIMEQEIKNRINNHLVKPRKKMIFLNNLL